MCLNCETHLSDDCLTRPACDESLEMERLLPKRRLAACWRGGVRYRQMEQAAFNVVSCRERHLVLSKESTFRSDASARSAEATCRSWWNP